MGLQKFYSGWLGAAGLIVGAVAASPAAAEEYPGSAVLLPDAVQLEPLSPWNIDFAANACRLSRIFGSEEKPHLLFFEQAAPEANFGLTFAGPEVRQFKYAKRIEIAAERGRTFRTIDYHMPGDVEQIGPGVIIRSLAIRGSEDKSGAEKGDPKQAPSPKLRTAGIDLEKAGTVDRFVLKRGKRVLSFETGNMEAAFQALNACTSDLLRSWGLDPEKHASYVPPQWSNEGVVVRRIQETYPSQARRRREQAIFRLRVIVERDGTVSECHLEDSTVTVSLESPACREMKGARFEPARDDSGEPMRSYYATTVSYILG